MRLHYLICKPMEKMIYSKHTFIKSECEIMILQIMCKMYNSITLPAAQVKTYSVSAWSPDRKRKGLGHRRK